MNLVERLREDAKAFANRFGADAEKLSIWEAADRLELLEAEITRLQKERDGIDEERRTALALVLERNAQIQALQKELETAREALEPFARVADSYEPDEGDDACVAWAHDFTIGSLRRARDARRTTKGGGE